MASANLAIENLAFAPLFVTAKGAKQLPALYKDRKPVAWQVGDYCEIPFEASVFANRVTLCFTPSETLCTQIEQLDKWCIDAVSANPSLLGISLTSEQVTDRYISSVKWSERVIRHCVPR